MHKTRSIVLTGLMIAIGLVIVTICRTLLGVSFMILFSPMHFPVLIAGLVLGPWEGLICGIVTPALSYLIIGLPQIGPLAMMAELGVYGLVTGLIMKKADKRKMSSIYLALVPAMILGRIAGGLITALLVSSYSFNVWITAHFVSTAPRYGSDLALHSLLLQPHSQ